MTRLVRFVRVLSTWLFWPGALLIAWGELTPRPPHLEGPFGWDKVDHFVAYFGLAAMATMVTGVRPRLAWAILGVILFGGVLEILQGLMGRDAELADFIANSIGALAGLAAAALFLRLPLVGARPGD
ncbi:MAG TPA: VanZ family protein [Rhizomicrobium sp.]|nr:VanZ family protein [Rhizomicrobium sp.]